MWCESYNEGVAIHPKALCLLTILLSKFSLLAQDKPLGDVTRESRAGKSQVPHAAKVITNEDFAGPVAQPVKVTDDPTEVVKRAEISLRHDTQHVCRSESAGNQGPQRGWTRTQVIEISGADRIHMVSNDSTSKEGSIEYIVVDKRVYVKSAITSWQRAEKLGWDEPKLTQLLYSSGIPNEMKFGYAPGDLKFIRTETIGGSPTFLYQDVIHAFAIDRTIRIWIGTNDGLLRRSEMTTGDPDTGSRDSESTNCSYGTAPAIQSPL